jgi:two-component system chemotaxis sensor kinase CheA
MANSEEGQPFLDEFMDDYYSECDEHLMSIRHILLHAERQPGWNTPATLQELFRSCHSLKGLSGMVGFRAAELLAHHMESYLRVLRDSQVAPTAAGVRALVRGTQALEFALAEKQAGRDAPDNSDVIADLVALAAPPGLSSPEASPRYPDTTPTAAQWRVDFSPSAALASQGIGVDRIRALLSEGGQIVEATPRVDPAGGISFEFIVHGDLRDLQATAAEYGLVVTEIPATGPAVTEVASSAPGVLNPSHFVRVELSRLDDLMRMIGDLVISRARLADSLSQVERKVPAAEWRGVQENCLALERQLRDLRDGVMRVRLVKVGEIFRRMPFVVRDLARESDRDVQLEITGQDTEIDKFVVERLMDPILHLVRNAVSHGIEPVAERLAAGKSAVGKVTLNASSVGDMVVLEVADDGHGVDLDRVARRARAAGLDLPEGRLDDTTLLSVLCTPGFSTRDSADRVSGRGVGMAVVQTTVQELGGQMTLSTVPGQGTRFSMAVPVTLSITDAILGRVGEQLFAVPQGAVREVIEVVPSDLQRIEHGELIAYRDGALPVVMLGRRFGLPTGSGRSLHVFVIGEALSAVGLAVDRILGQREIVVRPLNDPLIKIDGIAGATDLGDGRAVLILDPARIAASVRDRHAAGAARQGL